MIIRGDCLVEMSKMPSESIDLVITSPPYNIGNMHSNHIQHGTYANNNMAEGEYQEWQLLVLEEIYRILKPSGSLFYNHKVRIKNGRAIHPMEWLLKSPFVLKQEITWDMGKSANCDKIRFFPFSERIYWLTKSPNVRLYNKLNMSDVWRIVPTHKRKDKGHIAVMPDEVVESILNSVECQTVFDPFAGTGTTIRVATRMGKSASGVELNPEEN